MKKKLRTQEKTLKEEREKAKTLNELVDNYEEEKKEQQNKEEKSKEFRKRTQLQINTLKDIKQEMDEVQTPYIDQKI